MRGRYHFGTENLHASNIGPFLGNINLPHVNFTGHLKEGGGRGEGDSVLTRSRLGNQFGFAHFARQQSFAQAMINLVRAGMIQVFSFDIDLGAT